MAMITWSKTTESSTNIDGKEQSSRSSTSSINWTSVTGKPTTIAGYGITDAFNGVYSSLSGIPSSFTPAAHSHTFASLTSKPTTISGYGITDAYTKTQSDSNYAVKTPTIVTKTASYQLTAADNGKVILFNTGSAVNLTMTVNLGAGFNVQVINIHPTGVVTLVAGSATLNSKEVKLSSQWGGCTIIYSGTSTAIAMGDLTST